MFGKKKVAAKCFAELRTIVPDEASYIYIDSATYMADSLFAKYKITVKHLGEKGSKDTLLRGKYRFVPVRIAKKDKKKFLKAMKELPDAMLQAGDSEYLALLEEYEPFFKTVKKQLG